MKFQNPFPDAPSELHPKLAQFQPYYTVLIKKGEKFETSNASELIQQHHLPYLFKQRDEGVVIMSMPILDSSELIAILVYSLQNSDEVKRFLDNDPAIKAEVLKYQIQESLGAKGDTLS